MLIKKVKLVNYRQHADIDQVIDGTVIAVIGPNGSGKSNLLGGIQYAFIGEQPGYKKSALLRWGTKSGYARVEFEHNGQQCYIERNIHNAEVIFCYGDNTYKGNAGVAEALLAHVGLDKELARQAVFVGQTEIDGVLFTDPAVRERAFQRLMGIGDAGRIHTVIGSVLKSVSTPPNYDEYIAKANEQLTELTARLNDITLQEAAMTARLSKLAEVNVLQDTYNRLNTLLGLRSTIDSAKDNVTRYTSSITQLTAELAALPAVDGSVLAQLEADLAGYTKLHADLVQAKHANDRLNSAYFALNQHGNIPVDKAELARLDEIYNQAEAAVHKCRGEYVSQNNLLKAITATTDAEPICPVCGTALADPTAPVQRLQGILKKLVDDGTRFAEESKNAKDTRLAMISALQDWEGKYMRLKAEYDQAAAAVASLPKLDDTRGIDEVQQLINNATAKRGELTAALVKRQTIAGALQHVKTSLQSAEMSFNAEQDNCRLLGMDPDKLLDNEWYDQAVQHKQNIPAVIAEANGLQRDLAGVAGVITELNKQIVTVKSTAEDLVKKRDSYNDTKKAIEVVEQVRNWFHYANGPRTLSTQVLHALTGEVNKFLGYFDAPFMVTPIDNGFGFKYSYHDGRNMADDDGSDVIMLSGGQKIQLAIAFRFAAYAMFAASLGILSLDEPTTYLDANNVARFCVLLDRIKKVAMDLNIQLWLATHERSVMPFVDTKIVINTSAEEDHGKAV